MNEYKIVYSPAALDDLEAVYEYLIFYLVKPEDNSVVILRIIYGGRNIEDELKK